MVQAFIWQISLFALVLVGSGVIVATGLVHMVVLIVSAMLTALPKTSVHPRYHRSVLKEMLSTKWRITCTLQAPLARDVLLGRIVERVSDHQGLPTFLMRVQTALLTLLGFTSLNDLQAAPNKYGLAHTLGIDRYRGHSQDYELRSAIAEISAQQVQILEMRVGRSQALGSDRLPVGADGLSARYWRDRYHNLKDKDDELKN